MSQLNAVSVDAFRARGTISDADVLTFRRAFYEDGVIDLAEAEALFDLDAACPTQAPSFADCFIEMLTDYIVNQATPSGYIAAENAEWLMGRIAPDGVIHRKKDLDLLVNVIDRARWSPQSLTRFALDQVQRAVIDGSGPLREGKSLAPKAISEGEVELVKRIIYAFGGDGNIAITRAEAEVLFAIDAATADADNAASWKDLFVKAIANCVMSASGYATPPREQALAQDGWLKRRGELSLVHVAEGMARAGLGAGLSAYREQSSIERAIATLERQKIEIVTADEIHPADAQWLAETIGRDGHLSPNERALIDFLTANNAKLAPELAAKIDRLNKAA